MYGISRFRDGALAMALACVLLGCSTPGGLEQPNYNAGFGDGCAASSAAARTTAPLPQRNDALYAQDPGYRSGFVSGLAACRPPDGRPARL